MDQTTFTDVIQKSFIAMSMGSADKITTLNILINTSVSFLVGLFIFYIYRRTYQGVLYQHSFNVSLVLASVVTSLVIMTISGNLVLSLGMVGALSIVRFRTPVKDSMDLIFLFWAISCGIANGVGFYNIAIVGSTMIAIFLLILTKVRGKSDAYLLILQLTDEAVEESVVDIIKKESESMALKSKTVTASVVELTIELKLLEGRSEFVNELLKNDKISRATLVSYDQSLAAV